MVRPHRRRTFRWIVLLISGAAIVSLTFLFPRAPRHDGTTAPSAPPAGGTSSATTAKQLLAYEDAKAILAAFSPHLPADLKGKTADELAAAWPGWLRAHDAQIRARLERGDEDSVVNFWLYGTSFTSLPRATEPHLAALTTSAAQDLLLRRLDDLINGLASPGANERLRFAREVVDRHGIHPDTPAGRDQARDYLIQARERVLAEMARYRKTTREATGRADQPSVYATLYRDRGLSSDTSIAIDFAVDQTILAMKAAGQIAPNSIRRVAIIGPGLDFTDKAEGYDFYPQQTIQPFALIDSLTRAGLAAPAVLQVTTLDLSPRVNQHLDAARQRAEAGEPYVLQLPLNSDDNEHRWQPALVTYWQRLGDRIGDVIPPLAPPPGAGNVWVRSVRVPPAITLSIHPRDLNIVVERLETLPDRDRFDLILATNILVYYDAFEQSLALANVAAMLTPGGFFLTNYAVTPGPPMEESAALTTPVFWDRQRNGDTLFWYRRRSTSRASQ